MTVLLIWIIRILVLLLLARLVLRLIAAGRSAPARRQSARGVERAGGTLVRDPHCGTYLPKSRALSIGTGAETQYFCSVACRDAYGSKEGSNPFAKRV